MILWQILYDNLHYSIKERRWFYDLMLHNYFKLSDMTTVNISFLMTKILRDLDVKLVDLIQMKAILVKQKINGFSFGASIQRADDFAVLFASLENVEEKIWRECYEELVAWKLDEDLKNNHRNHQRKFKGKSRNGMNGLDMTDCKENEVTIFNDLTKISIRYDIDYSNSEEKRIWKEYRHRLKNIFRIFAGYNASSMRKKELKRFLEICDIKKYWNNNMIQEDIITMDQFVKYLCNEYINPAARDIKQHIEKQPEWALLLNALRFLEEIDADGNKEGLLKFSDFQKFGVNLALNDLETEILFNKIDKRDTGKITIDEVFEWFKKKLLQKHRGNKKHRRRKSSDSTNGSTKHKSPRKESSTDDEYILKSPKSICTVDTTPNYHNKTPLKIIRHKKKKDIKQKPKPKSTKRNQHRLKQATTDQDDSIDIPEVDVD